MGGTDPYNLVPMSEKGVYHTGADSYCVCWCVPGNMNSRQTCIKHILKRIQRKKWLQWLQHGHLTKILIWPNHAKSFQIYPNLLFKLEISLRSRSEGFEAEKENIGKHRKTKRFPPEIVACGQRAAQKPVWSPESPPAYQSPAARIILLLRIIYY